MKSLRQCPLGVQLVPCDVGGWCWLPPPECLLRAHLVRWRTFIVKGHRVNILGFVDQGYNSGTYITS